ncbi:hypothetical protein [Microbacterium sp. BR1]|uniref:hypothetical protein n=1 Tax=Microbacterium sp. BR1 TaxID=1070896 RepID=UPI0018E27F2F|nr:hypothetical protein [Microbacterium sp. BR1]
MTPKPEFGPDDFENPDAPEGERRLRSDHFEVRDLSYERSRMRQLIDLYKGAVFDPGWEKRDDLDPEDETTWQTERLETYIKERPRGKGYVADFVYNSKDLPVTVYGILINRGRGLEVTELELFRSSWGYFDGWSTFVDPDDSADVGETDEDDSPEPEQLITSDVLRRIPIGRIIAMSQQSLAQEEWRTDGIQVLMGRDRGPDELTHAETNALESAVLAANRTKRGRPPLPDETLAAVAHAYLEEAPAGVGLLKRLSQRFNRPEPTVRDWIATARREGFLTAAVPGKRGAAPGPRLTSATAATAVRPR